MPRRKNKNLREKAKRQADTFGDYDFDIPYLNTDGVTMYRPPEPDKGKKRSTATLDFLMFLVTQEHNPMEDPGEIWYERTFFVHTNVGPDEIKVLCPKRTFGNRCPICEYQASLKKKKGDYKEEIKALYPRQRQLFVLIDADDAEEQIQVWDVSTYLFGELLMEEISEDEDLSVFADLEEGLTIKVKFKQESIGPSVKFMRAVELDFEERDPFEDEIIDECPDLDSMLVEMPFDELEELFFCMPPDSEEEEEDEEPEEVEEPPTRRRRRRKVEEEEEEETEEETEEEDDEDEEAPSRRKRRNRRSTSRRANKEDDSDEDEEDEKPVRRSRRRKKVEEEEEEEEPKPTKKKRRKVTKEEDEEEEELECPIGGEFGKECGEYEECEECDVYSECYKAKPKRKRR